MEPPRYTALQKTLYPELDPAVTPLPTGFNPKDKFNHLDLSHGTLRVHYNGAGKSDMDAACARGNHPIPSSCGLFYFEVTVLNRGRHGYIGIGLCTQSASLNRLPGWEENSYGYHGDDGNAFHASSTGNAFGPQFTTNDTIGCGVNFVDNSCFYTKNGVLLGTAFRNLMPNLFPCVGMRTCGEIVEGNFGERAFKYDISGLIGEMRGKVQSAIYAQSLAGVFGRDRSVQGIMSKVVESYLAHNGFSETVRVFASATDAQLPPSALSIDPRKEIRKSILEGNIERAIAVTNEHFPGVLTGTSETVDHSLLFQLHCRVFIELIARKSPENAESHVNTVLECGMRLRELFERGSSADPVTAQANKTLLNDAYSLLAYSDPYQSPMAHLLDPKQREPIADQLNSAILGSLGLSRTSALERIARHTKVTLDEMLRVNIGKAAFVCVEDCL